jgi:hypothetical protein
VERCTYPRLPRLLSHPNSDDWRGRDKLQGRSAHHGRCHISCGGRGIRDAPLLPPLQCPASRLARTGAPIPVHPFRSPRRGISHSMLDVFCVYSVCNIHTRGEAHMRLRMCRRAGAQESYAGTSPICHISSPSASHVSPSSPTSPVSAAQSKAIICPHRVVLLAALIRPLLSDPSSMLF